MYVPWDTIDNIRNHRNLLISYSTIDHLVAGTTRRGVVPRPKWVSAAFSFKYLFPTSGKWKFNIGHRQWSTNISLTAKFWTCNLGVLARVIGTCKDHYSVRKDVLIPHRRFVSLLIQVGEKATVKIMVVIVNFDVCAYFSSNN